MFKDQSERDEVFARLNGLEFALRKLIEAVEILATQKPPPPPPASFRSPLALTYWRVPPEKKEEN